MSVIQWFQPYMPASKSITYRYANTIQNNLSAAGYLSDKKTDRIFEFVIIAGVFPF